jgi:hypothetical protein
VAGHKIRHPKKIPEEMSSIWTEVARENGKNAAHHCIDKGSDDDYHITYGRVTVPDSSKKEEKRLKYLYCIEYEKAFREIWDDPVHWPSDDYCCVK